jgi:4-diphosphocytidyl-2-C-methyl-D-erythritol kinase
MMPAITELAPAKVNLTLKVRGRRPDGLHQIESLIAFAAGVGDVVRLEPGDRTALRVCGPFAGAIGGMNLLEIALARLAAAEPRLALGSVVLEKRLPVAAGIGGGSADAGALLRAVRRANPTLADSVDWEAVAASLGADVPVCLKSRAALIWGAGEKMAPLPGLPRLEAVLVNPLADVPPDKTARVFARLKAPPAGASQAPPQSPARFADAAALIAHMRAHGNDLMAAAAELVPEIRDVRAALAAAPGCLLTGLSGAGPTCFAVFERPEEAAAAAAALRADHPRWWVAATALGG